jgi:glutamate mutase epsilon subunit
VALTQIKALAVPPEKEIECEINKIRALIKTIIAEQFELGNNDIESILRIMVKITSSRL